MKKIINNKVYDTDTARELGMDAGGDGFSGWCERLYQKRTGEFFLYGEGGPMTKYAHTIGQNSWSGGEKIMPLSAAKAREWAEEHLDGDDYEAIFGIPEEGPEKVTLCVQLSATLGAKIRAGASEAGKSLSGYIEQVLGESLK